MTTVKLAGEIELTLVGDLVKIGDKLTGLKFTNPQLEEISIEQIEGPILLNFFPSVDTGICANSVREFNKLVSEKVTLLNISGDLPFAQSRFCASQGLEKVQNLSTFRNTCSLKHLGLYIDTLPLRGLSARAQVLLNKDHIVTYVALNPEIKTEPNYELALAAIAAL